MRRKVLRSIPDTIYVVSSDLFQLDTATLPGKTSDDRKAKNLTFELIYDVNCDLETTFGKIFRYFIPELSNTVKSRSRISPVGWQIAGGQIPPPKGAQGPEIFQRGAG